MLTDRVRDTPQPKCPPNIYRPPFALNVKSCGQHGVEDRSGNCFLQALETVNLDFWEDTGTCVPVSLAQQGIWTNMGHRWACRNRYMLSEGHGSLSTHAHSRSDSLNTQLAGRISSQVLLIEVHISKVIYFFKASYCVPLLYIASYLLNHKLAHIWKMHLLTHQLHNVLSDWK